MPISLSLKSHEQVAPEKATATEQMSNRLKDRLIETAIDLALFEDLGGFSVDEGDITTVSTSTGGTPVRGIFTVKEAPCVIAGLFVAQKVFQRLNAGTTLTLLLEDGEVMEEAPGDIAIIEGPASAVLSGERLALNLMQRMSGIATTARRYADIAFPYGIAILDTRKTAPALRVFDKMAVAIGGGKNHRFGLFDTILIKDNHISLAGGIKEAVRSARKKAAGRPIEIETTCLSEVSEALQEGVDTIMLDNMTPQLVRQAVSLIKGRAKIEISGGINLSSINDYLIEGVDAISVGALTHSVRSVDISLEVEKLA